MPRFATAFVPLIISLLLSVSWLLVPGPARVQDGPGADERPDRSILLDVGER